MKILSDIFTGKDGTTHDIARYAWAISIFSVIAAAAANWWHSGNIDLVSFGSVLSGISVTHGVALLAKKDTEPSP